VPPPSVFVRVPLHAPAPEGLRTTLTQLDSIWAGSGPAKPPLRNVCQKKPRTPKIGFASHQPASSAVLRCPSRTPAPQVWALLSPNPKTTTTPSVSFCFPWLEQDRDQNQPCTTVFSPVNLFVARSRRDWPLVCTTPLRGHAPGSFPPPAKVHPVVCPQHLDPGGP